MNRITDGLDLRCEREKEKRKIGNFWILPEMGRWQLELLAEEEEKFNLGHTEVSMTVKPVEMMGMHLNIPAWSCQVTCATNISTLEMIRREGIE